ncbi:hypothetical protein R3I93_012380 [Phoxinus phoxinus]|uniref:Uncharacterized protein n=1 Tax=Phoxinus phoxinus TaxID=58324 RepID=A0AAN9CRJ7_9TELE
MTRRFLNQRVTVDRWIRARGLEKPMIRLLPHLPPEGERRCSSVQDSSGAAHTTARVTQMRHETSRASDNDTRLSTLRQDPAWIMTADR